MQGRAVAQMLRRSSSAWAKDALATFRISLVRRSSLFSRSSSLTRCASDVVTPSRTPVSISTRLTHVSSVCGTQPIFGAIDSTASHSDGYSLRCSCTRRTARSRTSGENLFDLFMAQSSQRVEPPQNPGRFRELRQHVQARLRQSHGPQRCPDRSGATACGVWTYPDLTDTLGLDLHFAAEVNSAVAGMAALALLSISFSKLMGDF